MVAVLPTRFVPGAILAAAFACVGIETGLLLSGIVRPEPLLPTHWACVPLFALAWVYVRKIWCEGHHRHPIRRITALSPRSQALIFALCLGIGLSTGALLTFATH